MSKEQVFDRSKYISGIDPYDKKETLEEFIRKSYLSRLEDCLSVDFEDGVKLGAKWQQEQMEKLRDFDTWKEWKNKSE